MKVKRFLTPNFLVFLGGLFIGLCLFLVIILTSPDNLTSKSVNNTTPSQAEITNITPTLLPLPSLSPTKILPTSYHIFQSFNNCGPASLSMALAFYGISISQEELGQALRPYQVAGGDNDDKSVTLSELAQKAKEYGLLPYHRPNGSIETMKQFIAQDIPVITRTWLTSEEDIGHFRVVKGYDENTQQLIQDDSFQNKNLRYSYGDFNQIWKKFNYEYLVLIPKNKEEVAKQILGDNFDEKSSWDHAVTTITSEIEKDPNDIYNHFNLSVAYYHTENFREAIVEYEKVADKLPFRTLWYQIEPIQAYYEVGNYKKVFEITDTTLNNQNRAFSELYIIRGDIYKKQGNMTASKAEYEKAVYYNQHLKEAKNALNSL